MNEKIDLERNLEELEDYTEQEAAREFALLERHLTNIYEGNKIAFCKACLSKHYLTLKGVGEECLEGSCRPKKIWKKITDWANYADSKIEELGKGKEITLELARQAREFRKILMDKIDQMKEKEPASAGIGKERLK